MPLELPPMEPRWEPRTSGPPPERCQWIEGEPSRHDRCKCGRTAAPGRSYCRAHLRRCLRERLLTAIMDGRTSDEFSRSLVA